MVVVHTLAQTEEVQDDHMLILWVHNFVLVGHRLYLDVPRVQLVVHNSFQGFSRVQVDYNLIQGASRVQLVHNLLLGISEVQVDHKLAQDVLWVQEVHKQVQDGDVDGV